MNNTELEHYSIILDQNIYSKETIDIALDYAELAHKNNHSKVQLVFPAALLAEITQGIANEHSWRYHGAHNEVQKRHRILSAEKSDNLARNKPLAELLRDHQEYIVIPELGHTDRALLQCMAQYLEKIQDLSPGLLADIFKNISSVTFNDEQEEIEIRDLLQSDIDAYTKAYTYCRNDPGFRALLEQSRLHKDMGDKSVMDWYAKHAEQFPKDNVLLVSRDNKLLKAMQNQHNIAGLGDYLQRFEYFDHQGFVSHVQSELEAMHARDPDMQAKIDNCKEKCAQFLLTKQLPVEMVHEARFTESSPLLSR